jgi:hypothetical protein
MRRRRRQKKYPNPRPPCTIGHSLSDRQTDRQTFGVLPSRLAGMMRTLAWLACLRLTAEH